MKYLESFDMNFRDWIKRKPDIDIEEWDDLEDLEFEEYNKSDCLETLFKYKDKALYYKKTNVFFTITDIYTETKGYNMKLIGFRLKKIGGKKNGVKTTKPSLISSFCKDVANLRQDFLEIEDLYKKFDEIKKMGIE